jgi:ABC-type nitrate/sulfonate/bicarbonate transport system substrate-binding protein
MHRRRFHQWLSLAGIASAGTVSLSTARAQGRPVLKAGDQKGGLHALLEAAGELKGLSYDIQWTEFPAAAPLAEALNAQAVDLGPIGDAPLIFSLAAGSRSRPSPSTVPTPMARRCWWRRPRRSRRRAISRAAAWPPTAARSATSSRSRPWPRRA